jgi:hypothetical protein
MDHVADVTVGFINALALRVDIEAAAKSVEKSFVRDAEPRPPNRCRANDDPGDIEAAGADDFFAFDLAGAVKGEGSVFIVAPGLGGGGMDVTGRSKDDALDRRMAADGGDDVVDAGSVSGVIQQGRAVKVATGSKMNEPCGLEGLDGGAQGVGIENIAGNIVRGVSAIGRRSMVEIADFEAIVQQGLDEIGANETGTAGNEDSSHGCSIALAKVAGVTAPAGAGDRPVRDENAGDGAWAGRNPANG